MLGIAKQVGTVETIEEVDSLNNQSWVLKNEKNAIIAQMKLDEQSELAKIARAEKIAFKIVWFDATIENEKVQSDQSIDVDTRNEMYAKYREIDEKMDNILLGSAAIKKVPFVTGTVQTGEPKQGTKTEQIVTLYKQFVADGMTDTNARKSVVLAGFNDGTMGIAVKNYLDSLKG